MKCACVRPVIFAKSVVCVRVCGRHQGPPSKRHSGKGASIGECDYRINHTYSQCIGIRHAFQSAGMCLPHCWHTSLREEYVCVCGFLAQFERKPVSSSICRRRYLAYHRHRGLLHHTTVCGVHPLGARFESKQYNAIIRASFVHSRRECLVAPRV